MVKIPTVHLNYDESKELVDQLYKGLYDKYNISNITELEISNMGCISLVHIEKND